MTHSSAIKSLLSYLLVASFLLTPLSPAIAMIEGSSGGSTNSTPSTPGTNNGGLVGGDNLDDEEDDDDEESEEEKDKKEADNTAAEIASAIEAAGLSGALGVEPVYGAEPSGSAVSVAGVSMGKEEALAAISAMSAANSIGAIGVTAIDKTLEGYANGSVCTGCVVGFNTGVTGPPQEVAQAEIDYTIATGVVVDVRKIKDLVPAVGKGTAIPANNISQALLSTYSQLADSAKEAGILNLSGTTQITNDGKGITQNVLKQYAELGEGLQQAGNTNLSATGGNSSYTYDSTTGKFTGTKNGMSVQAEYIPNSDLVKTIAEDNPNSFITLDLSSGEGVITTQSLITGVTSNFSAETGEWLDNGSFNLYDGSAGYNTLERTQSILDDTVVLKTCTGDTCPRGVENNNPLNIEINPNNPWVGAVPGSDQRFATFENPELGIRAATRVILNYQDKYGLDTLSEIINRWAPEEDGNDTAAYINAVVKSTGFNANEVLDLKSAPVMVKLLAAMAEVEVGGNFYPEDQLLAGVNLGLESKGYPITGMSPDAVIKILTTKTSPSGVQVASIITDPVTDYSNYAFSYVPPSKTNNAALVAIDQATEETKLITATEKLTESEARTILSGAGITVNPAGDGSGLAQLDGVVAGAVQMAITIKDLCGCNLHITEGTGGEHADGIHSHENGFKLDIRIKDNPELVAYVKGLKFVANLNIGPKYKDPETGYIYILESDHLDVQYIPNSDNETVAVPGSSDTSGGLGTLLGDVSGALSGLGGLLGGGSETETGKESPTILDNLMTGVGDLANNKTIQEAYIKGWFMNLFGGFDGGTLRDSIDENTNNSDGDDNDNLYNCTIQTSTSTITFSTTTPCSNLNSQGGTAILSGAGQIFNGLVGKLFGWLAGNDKQSGLATDDNITIPVTITINDQNGAVQLSREDIINDLEINRDYYLRSETAVFNLIDTLNQTPFLFNDSGKLIYSNGLYSPAVENGELVTTNENYSYVYIVRHIDKDGNEMEQETNKDALPDNYLTELLRRAVVSNDSFNTNSVRSITYHLVNPKNEIPGDEYYKYNITMLDGDIRTVTVPQFTSIKFMQERFSSIGYNDDILALIAQAKELPEPPSNTRRILNAAGNLITKFTDIFKGDESADNNTTILPEFVHTPQSSDVKSVFIYPNSNVPCAASVEEYEYGYMYTAIINDPEDTNYAYVVTDGRCGKGNTNDLIAETARHLAETYGVINTDYETIVNKTSFIVEPTLFNPGVTKISIQPISPTIPADDSNIDTVDNTPVTTSSSTSTQLPNLTNEVVFEIKAVASDGRVLSDWVDTEEITISEGVELYFRWNGSSYQQCLAFLNDNGNYSLTRSNRAMITGNTEDEQYDVTERSATYRVECGGQRNNEFGVDAREIEVTVQ